jgi:copper chaperone CopZ
MAKEISNFNLDSTNDVFCEKSIFSSIKKLRGIDNILINSSKKKVMVEYNPDQTTMNDIIYTIEKQGYSVS